MNLEKLKLEKFKNPPLDYFKNKKILIMGLGINGGGVGATKFFANLGAKVTVTDLKTERELKKSLNQLKEFKNIKFVLGRHEAKDFYTHDIVIKNPAVRWDSPYLKIAQQNNIPIHTDVSLYFLLTPAYTIGVTGTKGKSTTCNLIYNILKSKYKAVLAGNIGISLLEILPKLDGSHIVIAELSSWQTETLKFVKKSPSIAIITNISYDHLNTYKDFESYQEAKFTLAKWQKPEDEFFLHFSLYKTFLKFNKKWHFKGKINFYKLSKKFSKQLEKSNFKLLGQGAKENALIAFKIGKLFGLEDKTIFNLLSKVKPLFGRLQPITSGKILWINDTCSTNPFSTVSSIKSFKKKPILITGGTDKNLPAKFLARVIKKRVKKLILLPGSFTEKLKKELKNFPFNEVKNLKEAVILARKFAQFHDIVLFSPASASFELFKNEFDRGKKFIKLVKQLR